MVKLKKEKKEIEKENKQNHDYEIFLLYQKQTNWDYAYYKIIKNILC